MSANQHEEHCRNVVFRAVLQIFVDKYKLELKKKRRKAVRKCDCDDFSAFLQNIENVYDLDLSDEMLKDLEGIYMKKCDLYNYVENITGLQEIWVSSSSMI